MMSALQKHWRAVILLCIVLTAAGLRFFRLGFQSLWLDELFSRANGLEPNLRDVVLSAARDVHPPGYPILSYITAHLIGDTEAALRTPSALAGVASVALMYLIGRRLRSAYVGTTAAALMATHWFAIHYSQENRAYSLLLLMSCAIGLLGIRIVQRHSAGEPTALDLVALATIGSIASYLHYFGLLFFACVGMVLGVLALKRHAPLWPMLGAYGAAALSYLPWVPTMLAQAGAEDVPSRPASLVKIGKTYVEMSAKHPGWLVVLLVLGIIAHRGQRQLRRNESNTQADTEAKPLASATAVALTWAALPVLLTVLLSQLVPSLYTSRNLIVVLPGVVLLAAFALERIDHHWFAARPFAASLVACALLVDLVVLKQYYTTPMKEPFRQLTAHVLTVTPRGDTFVVWSTPPRYARHFNQYFAMLGSDIRVSAQPANGRPPGDPTTLWILSRGEKPKPPPGYRQESALHHAPVALNPWPGKRMTATRYVREPR